jgi:hypothetical protein
MGTPSECRRTGWGGKRFTNSWKKNILNARNLGTLLKKAKNLKSYSLWTNLYKPFDVWQADNTLANDTAVYYISTIELFQNHGLSSTIDEVSNILVYFFIPYS